MRGRPPANRKWDIMAAPVASSRSADTPARLHVWRVLTMLAALVGVVCMLVLILTSAA